MVILFRYVSPTSDAKEHPLALSYRAPAFKRAFKMCLGSRYIYCSKYLFTIMTYRMNIKRKFLHSSAFTQNSRYHSLHINVFGIKIYLLYGRFCTVSIYCPSFRLQETTFVCFYTVSKGAFPQLI